MGAGFSKPTLLGFCAAAGLGLGFLLLGGKRANTAQVTSAVYRVFSAMPGAVGAIMGARNARKGGGYKPTRYTASEQRRHEEKWAEYERKVKYGKLLRQYDVNKSGKLEKDQVLKLLTDNDFSTPAGTPPSQEEVDYIIKCADRAGDGCIDKEELADALSSFQTYVKLKPELDICMERFDKSKTGNLNRDEIHQCLIYLNSDKPVSENEVDMIMKDADVLGDGVISKQELARALNLWFTYVDQKASCMCTIS